MEFLIGFIAILIAICYIARLSMVDTSHQHESELDTTYSDQLRKLIDEASKRQSEPTPLWSHTTYYEKPWRKVRRSKRKEKNDE